MWMHQHGIILLDRICKLEFLPDIIVEMMPLKINLKTKHIKLYSLPAEPKNSSKVQVNVMMSNCFASQVIMLLLKFLTQELLDVHRSS